jgi:hypothetical protein
LISTEICESPPTVKKKNLPIINCYWQGLFQLHQVLAILLFINDYIISFVYLYCITMFGLRSSFFILKSICLSACLSCYMFLCLLFSVTTSIVLFVCCCSPFYPLVFFPLSPPVYCSLCNLYFSVTLSLFSVFTLLYFPTSLLQ